MEGIGELCVATPCLLLLDTVTIARPCAVYLDAWGVDLASSCSQKASVWPPRPSDPSAWGPSAEAQLAGARQGANGTFDVSLPNLLGRTGSITTPAPVKHELACGEALRLLRKRAWRTPGPADRQNAEPARAGLWRLGLEFACSRSPCPAHAHARAQPLKAIDGQASAFTLLPPRHRGWVAAWAPLAARSGAIGPDGYNSRAEKRGSAAQSA